MYAYALQASLGDDVYLEPTAHSLEVHIAKLTGKEAALFMPSGTMSNQIALRTHLVQPPYSMLCDYRSHINKYVSRPCIGPSLHSDYLFTADSSETGGTAFHSGAHTVAVIPHNRHHLTLSDVKQFIIQGSNVHVYETARRGLGLHAD
jgi:threonine aldolase